MDATQLQAVKTQLAAVIGDLAAKKANPYKGTALEALSEEIRAMRKTYGLSYREIAEKLIALKVETDEEKVGAFCRFLMKTAPKRGSARRLRTRQS